jgi:hypothetical protein
MKIGIKQCGFNQISHIGESITDEMRFYIQVNPTSYLVYKTKNGWKELKSKVKSNDK